MPQTANDLVTRADIQAVITETAQRLSSRLKSADFEQRVDGLSLRLLSRADYDALAVKNPDTVYFIIEPADAVTACIGTIHITDEKELVFGSRFEFPSVGDPNKLYIATNERKSYFFDASALTYVALGTQLDDISQISGGNAFT